MNARTETFELTVEGQQIEEAVASIFHTLLLHRTLGKFHYQSEGSYSIGTIGTEDIECNFIDLTYVRVNSAELSRTLDTQITAFNNYLRSEVDKQRNGGHVCLEFYQKHKRQWPLSEDIAPWEVWTVKLDVIKVANEAEHQQWRENVGEKLSDIILNICQAINRPNYMPKMPALAELSYVFDTRFKDVQPYLFRLVYEANLPPSGGSVASQMKKLFRDTLSL